jgi:hypothetical protein
VWVLRRLVLESVVMWAFALALLVLAQVQTLA